MILQYNNSSRKITENNIPMKPGIYDGISNADYHGGPGISVSGLKLIAERSPLHFKASRDAKQNADQGEEKESAALRIGTAFHMLMLEPAEFTRTYTLALRPMDVPGALMEKAELVALVDKLNASRLPKLSATGTKQEVAARIMEAAPWSDREDVEAMDGKALKAAVDRLNEKRPGLLSTTGTIPQLLQLLRENGQAVTWWDDVKAEWLRNNAQRQVLTQEEFDQLRAMRDAVMAHPAARALMTNCPGTAERSVYWTDPATGELCRCRPDFWRDDGILVDLKTTDDASPEGFARSVVKFRYDLQDPFYLDGVAQAIKQSRSKMKTPQVFIFLAVEKEFPHAVAVYRLDDASRALGRADYQRHLVNYAECTRADKWPGYGELIQNITVPQWHANKLAPLIGA